MNAGHGKSLTQLHRWLGGQQPMLEPALAAGTIITMCQYFGPILPNTARTLFAAAERLGAVDERQEAQVQLENGDLS